MKIILIGIIPLLMFCCNSKDDDCSSIDPPCYCANFTIVDSTGMSIIGKDRRYDFDSVSIVNESDSIRFYMEDTIVQFYYNDWIEDKTYTLRVGSNLTYELKLKFIVFSGECFDRVEIDDFYANDEYINQSDLDLFVIE